MSALERARAGLAALGAVDRPEVWIALRAPADVLAEAAAVDARVAAGHDLPLAGTLLAVKNNVDVAGLETTAACPGFAAGPATRDAAAVARLRAAGAVVLGATNLDQFATGLVGTRSPHGAVRDSRRPGHVSGGSSSGSAVAVALGLVDLAVGTDTAGSGRVPAALQGVVGIKATLGVVSTDGVVPACRSWDAVTVLARDLGTARVAMGVMAGGEGTRPWPADAPLAAPPEPVVAVPASLPPMAPGWTAAFDAAVARLAASGARLVAVDLDPFLAAARLLYDGALVAERHAAVGSFVDLYADDPACGLDPTVAGIISAAGRLSASAYVHDTARLAQLRALAVGQLTGCDALLLPTAPRHPTIAQVAADPVGVNSAMGTFTNFANLFDLCAVAVPAGVVEEPGDGEPGDGEPEDGAPGEGGAWTAQFGVSVLGAAFADAVVADVAARVALAPDPPALAAAGAAPLVPTAVCWPVAAGAGALPLVVVGAHRRGQVLEGELTAAGAVWDAVVTTSPDYRLVALDTVPPKPGLVRSRADGPDRARGGVVGERWWLPPAALGVFLSRLPPPMLLGAVELADGTWATGFACDAEAGALGTDLGAQRDWVAALAATTVPATGPGLSAPR